MLVNDSARRFPAPPLPETAVRNAAVRANQKPHESFSKRVMRDWDLANTSIDTYVAEQKNPIQNAWREKNLTNEKSAVPRDRKEHESVRPTAREYAEIPNAEERIDPTYSINNKLGQFPPRVTSALASKAASKTLTPQQEVIDQSCSVMLL